MKQKKYFDGFLLVLLFGPFGLFYANPVSGFVGIGISIVLILMGLEAALPIVWILSFAMMFSDVHEARKTNG